MLRRKRVRPETPIRRRKGPKPKLPMMVSYVCRVHFRALEAYLMTVYRMRDYDVCMASGAKGSMVPEFVVDGKLPPAPNIRQQVDNIRRGRRTRNLGLILNVLCMDEFIPAGKYVIDTREEPNLIIRYTQLLNDTHDPLAPECLAMKERHKHDREFMKRAKLLDGLRNGLKRQPIEERTDD